MIKKIPTLNEAEKCIKFHKVEDEKKKSFRALTEPSFKYSISLMDRTLIKNIFPFFKCELLDKKKNNIYHNLS